MGFNFETIRIESSAGTSGWCLYCRDVELLNVVSRISYFGTVENFQIAISQADNSKCQIMCKEKNFKLQHEIRFLNDSTLELASKLCNYSDRAIVVKSVQLAGFGENSNLNLQAAKESYRVLATTYDMLGGSRPWIKQLCEEKYGDMPGDYADMVGAIWSTESRNTLVFGSVGQASYPLRVCWRDGDVDGLYIDRIMNIRVEAGENIDLGKICIRHGKDLVKELQGYAAANFTARTTKPLASGWNSWDYYLDHPTFDGVVENINAIKSNPVLNEKLKIVCLDMGWYNRLGDYRASIDFPGRAQTAKHILEHGFVPGVWTMPLGVEPHTWIAREHPDWLIRSGDGDPVNIWADWGMQVYCLDTTVEQVQEHLFNLYRQMYNEGFRYYKLDFLRSAYKQPECLLSKSGVSRCQMVRRTLEIIREAVGNQSVIMACAGGVFEAAQGVVDAVRVANDVKIFWSNFQHCASQIAHRFWAHHNLWINDPDFCVVRGTDTADLSQERYICPVPKQHKDFAFVSGTAPTLNEIRVWATLQIICGGPLMLADRISMLNEKGLQILETVLKHHRPGEFVPVDLMDNPAPCIWARLASESGYECGNYDMLAIFNWSDKNRHFHLPRIDTSNTWQDIWKDSVVKIVGGIEVEARNVVLLGRRA